MNEELWNRCDWCGQFISMADFDSGKAVRKMSSPDSDLSCEEFETTCARCCDMGRARTVLKEIAQ